MIHIPSQAETLLLQSLLEHNRSEYVVFRVTDTMLNKSIIDANRSIYGFLKEQELLDFDLVMDGDKYYLEGDLFTPNEVRQKKVSCYRPKAKPQKRGDPRFWPYDFKKIVKAGDLVYLGALGGRLIIIPLVNEVINSQTTTQYFGAKPSSMGPQLKKVVTFLRKYKGIWFKSVSPKRKNDKDVGETFEQLLGVSANNDKSADLDGELELKTKRIKSKTDNTLFCKVPDREKTPLKNVRNIILTYGYPSRDEKRPEYIDLFVTVTTQPNPQGLYHKINRDDEQLEQYHVQSGVETLVAVWSFDVLKKALENKHPSTAWIGANEKKEAGNIYFNYSQLEVTHEPLFQNFLLLLETGAIVFDWRGGQHPKKGAGKAIDYGHAFRLKQGVGKDFLFGSNEVIEI